MMKRIDGKRIEIKKLVIENADERLDMHLNVKVDDRSLNLTFYNLNSLRINDISCPFTIEGFEILDNKSKGWESSSRYTVNDYENGDLKFHCESFDIQD